MTMHTYILNKDTLELKKINSIDARLLPSTTGRITEDGHMVILERNAVMAMKEVAFLAMKHTPQA